jgi:hypothetical protein
MEDAIFKTVQILSVVVGVVITIRTFSWTRLKEAEAQKLAAAKPFLELRQKLYLEAVRAAGVLANPEIHTEEEKKIAKKRFRELYVAELSMVEVREVEAQMVHLAAIIDPELVRLKPQQTAAYDLAHALRDSFTESWGIAHQ